MMMLHMAVRESFATDFGDTVVGDPAYYFDRQEEGEPSSLDTEYRSFDSNDSSMMNSSQDEEEEDDDNDDSDSDWDYWQHDEDGGSPSANDEFIVTGNPVDENDAPIDMDVLSYIWEQIIQLNAQKHTRRHLKFIQLSKLLESEIERLIMYRDTVASVLEVDAPYNQPRHQDANHPSEYDVPCHLQFPSLTDIEVPLVLLNEVLQTLYICAASLSPASNTTAAGDVKEQPARGVQKQTASSSSLILLRHLQSLDSTMSTAVEMLCSICWSPSPVNGCLRIVI